LLGLSAVGDNVAMNEPPKAEPPKRKRRWFQFSLRTLLIVVTLLAVPLGWVAWQAKIVRERKELRDKVKSDRGWVYAFGDFGRFGWHPAPKGSVDIPWIRRCLSDEAVIEIDVPMGAEFDEEFNAAKRLFPEANASRIEKLGSTLPLLPDAGESLGKWPPATR
jgi:hypothetical protein